MVLRISINQSLNQYEGVNSSIGSHWRYRIDAVDEQIKIMTEGMTEAELNSTQLNVKLIY